MPYSIDRSRCLCCHNCALECPVQAISYVGTGYSVDPEKCIDCGHCARVCNVDAARSDRPEPEAPKHETEHLSADVVVLGAGAAGIVAAARAAQLIGGRVILLEKAKKYGGSGWFAGFSAPAEDGGSVMPPMFEKAREKLIEGGIDPALMLLAASTPVRFFSWLRELDPRVEQLWVLRPGRGGRMGYELAKREFFNLKCKDNAIGPGRSTSVMEKIVTDHFPELGVELLCSHRAVKILKDESGAVSGVVAENPGGLVEISCRAVISCTGGFAHNDELLRRYVPHFFGGAGDEPTHRFAAPTTTGDVVALGESAGAFLDTDNFFANVFGPVHHPFSYCLFKFCCNGEVVNVNLNGERFMNESAFTSGAAKIIHQPGRISWSIVDSDTRALITARLKGADSSGAMDVIDSDFEEEAALDTPVKKADTLAELAKKCGIAEEKLLDTVAKYNAACASGCDADFGKRPEDMRPIANGPFYAIYGKVATDGAFGGMLVDGRLQVYNADKSGVIPGLYAAGDNASGWALRSKEPGDHRLMVCNECNWAISSGFTAAENAAEYLGK